MFIGRAILKEQVGTDGQTDPCLLRRCMDRSKYIGLSNSIEQNPWVNASWRLGHHKFPHLVYKPEVYRSHCWSYYTTIIQSQCSKSVS